MIANYTDFAFQVPMLSFALPSDEIIQTDRSGLQLSQVLTKNYSNAPRVPMGILGSVCDPRI